MTPHSSSVVGTIGRLVFAMLAGALSIASCSSDVDAPAPTNAVEDARDPGAGQQPGPTDDTRAATDAAPRPRDAGAAAAPDAKAAAPPPDIYDPDAIPKFELTFDAAAMAVLTSLTRETKDTWVHASFKFGGVSFADVGVRTKGAYTFRVLPQKASLKVKFNKWVKGQKLHGLEELTLNNMVADKTGLDQRLSYHVFRALGLPAQRANTAQVAINGEDYGIYANVETPDENFVARAFGAKGTSLYEVHGGGAWLPGSDSRWETDVRAPGAPEGSRPDLALLFQAVAAASDATLLTDLDGRLHTKQWLRFCAAEAVTGHYDGYAYGAYTHNYFMAGDTSGKFSLVPWSTDTTFNGAANAALPHADVVLSRCRRSSACWDAYKAEVNSVLPAFEALDLVALATKWHGQIDALQRADPKREHSIASYEKATNALYLWIAERPNVVRAQLGL
jgi:spore coat protein H